MRSLGVFSIILILAFTALQIPYVQTKIMHYIADYLTEKTGFPTTINAINIQWFDRLKAKQVNIKDPDGYPMIHATEVLIDFEISALWSKSDKVVDFVQIDSATVFARIMVFEDTIDNLNLTEFFNRIRELNAVEGSQNPSVIFGEVVLKNSFFAYQDTRKEKPYSDFNYNNFKVSHIDAHLFNFNIRSDTLQMQIQNLNGHVPDNDLPIHSITGEFRYSKKAVEFNDIEIRIGKSIIRDTVILAYDNPQDLQKFNTNVNITGKLKNSQIHTEDLRLFVPQVSHIGDLYRLSGTFNGRVNDFHLTDATLEFGRATKLKGEIRMEGLPHIDETFMNYYLNDSYVLIQDLRPYINESTIERMKDLHYFYLDGQLIGFINDFVANGVFETKLGKVISDLNLKLHKEINNSEYSGKISLIDFDLQKYSKNPLVGKVSLNGIVKGKGITAENADFTLEGSISSIELKNYKYKNIETKGHFKNRFFQGTMSINDPNANALFSGSIDLTNNKEKFVLNTSINTLRLQPLNLSKRNISIKGDAVVNASGLALDSILGEGVISNAFIQVDDDSLSIDTLHVYSEKSEETRIIQLNSDLVDFTIEGEFIPTETYKSLRQLVKEYKLGINNNSQELNDYYSSKVINDLNDYDIDFELAIIDFNPLLNLFNDSIYIAPKTKVKGELIGGYTSIFNFDFNSDSIRFKNNAFKNIASEISVSKIADSTDVLSMIYISSDKQQLGKAIHTEKLLFESIWNNNLIDFQFHIQQQNSTNRSDINGNLVFLKDNIHINFHDSDLLLYEKKWVIPKDNLIAFSKGEISFEGFEIRQGNQQISVNGKLNRSTDEALQINIDSVNISNLNPILLKPIEGTLTGRISFVDVYDNLKMNLIASVTDFEVDGIKVGNITASTFYNDLNKKSDVTIVVKKSDKLIGAIKGTYEQGKENQLNLEAKIEDAPLNILEPFFKTYFSSVQGLVTAEVNISGTPLHPVLNGKGVINDGGFFVDYLNTFYDFSGPFSAGKDNFSFHNLAISDVENHNGTLYGNIFHNSFHDWVLDLHGQVSNFLVLNTTSKDNSLFYGTGYGSGNISFKGDVNNLTIAAKARTESGTRIFIPLGETNDVKQKEFINFVNFTDTTNTIVETSKELDLTGINLDLALEVTTEAYSEIIFDIKSGDIIRGRGEGDLRMVMDATGEFSMFGDFYIREGGYNFTLYNIVNKEFQILPNSRISWYGDPYEGQMDIKASYEQLSSLKPVIPEIATLPTDAIIPPEIQRQYPSKVLMDLKGPLLYPNIEFDIAVENLPNYTVDLDGTPIEMNFLFSRFKDSWDEQELNRQVFSLIVLRKFSPLQSFSTGGSIASSVSELLSNQLSYWMTQVDENLEIDVNLGSLDNEALNTFQLRLAYTMFDGRLRIIRDGGIINQNPATTNDASNVSAYIGDWTVEYLLTQDGKLRVKMYNKTNYNTIDQQNPNNVMTTGFSIQHTQSFDEIKELFRKSRDNSKKSNPNGGNALNKDAKKNEDEVL